MWIVRTGKRCTAAGWIVRLDEVGGSSGTAGGVGSGQGCRMRRGYEGDLGGDVGQGQEVTKGQGCQFGLG